jgi:hypothetical protein
MRPIVWKSTFENWIFPNTFPTKISIRNPAMFPLSTIRFKNYKKIYQISYKKDCHLVFPTTHSRKYLFVPFVLNLSSVSTPDYKMRNKLVQNEVF